MLLKFYGMYKKEKARIFEFRGENSLAQSPKIQFALILAKEAGLMQTNC